jgi:glycosyltransferase involved in cell wall biosynthesis
MSILAHRIRHFDTAVDLEHIESCLKALRPAASSRPDVSVVVPVNARGDLANIFHLLSDIARYNGRLTLEVVLVVNNFEPDDPPAEIEQYQRLGACTVAIPNVRRADRPGEVVCLSARILGVRAASSEFVVLFDADCRIPNITALLDWYVEQFRIGAQAAYTHVSYYDFTDALAIHVKFAIHHTARWFKRNLLRIPTTRGSNYAVRRQSMIELYEEGMLADELNVGPTFKALKGRVGYSASRDLQVFTSGRVFSASWRRIIPYYVYRLRYNIRVLPVRRDAARHTHRERKDPANRYDYESIVARRGS